MKDRPRSVERLKSLLASAAFPDDELHADKERSLAREIGAAICSKRLLIALAWAAGGSAIVVTSVSLTAHTERNPNSRKAQVHALQPAARPMNNTAEPTRNRLDPYIGAVLTGCRQDVCSWDKVLSVRTVRRLPSGTLKVEQSYQGTSNDRAAHYRHHYSRSINIKWEQGAVKTYVFCSRSQPSIAFKDRWPGGTGKWLGHLLDLYDTYGYNTPSAQTYMRVCHGVKFDRDDIARLLAKLGYKPGTRNEQVELSSPDKLPDPPPRN